MTTDKRGLYVHVPFCKAKCNYCDFCSYPALYESRADKYIDRLISEAWEYSRDRRIQVDTVYFGGGTPSLLEPEQLGRLLLSLGEIFDIDREAEITLEANPGTLTEQKLRGYKELGINRISLGLQTIHENELKILGRIHTFSDFLDSYKMLRDLGFNNISIDLMYGIPEQTQASFEKTLDAAIALRPEHISAYGLIVEEGTPFYGMRDKLPLPTEDEECEMYAMAAERLRDSGYAHYEISNYARSGFESRHNLKYWRAEEYIGLGAAAYSYFEGYRYGNVRSLDGYMSGEPRGDVEHIDREGEMLEYAMMRLRLAEGISLGEYESRFGIPFTEGREEKLARYRDLGLITENCGRLSFTERGFYLSNAVMADIL